MEITNAVEQERYVCHCLSKAASLLHILLSLFDNLISSVFYKLHSRPPKKKFPSNYLRDNIQSLNERDSKQTKYSPLPKKASEVAPNPMEKDC